MSNRCYLFSCNEIPHSENDQIRVTGIAEWNYDIPLVFKLLMSGDPKVCETLAFADEEPGEIAIVGDFESGLTALKNFFQTIESPFTRPFIQEALEFLNRESNQGKYFLLEAGEVFEMDDGDLSLEEATLCTLDEINHVQQEVKAGLALIEQEEASQNPQPPFEIGLDCYWSNALCIDPNDDEDD